MLFNIVANSPSISKIATEQIAKITNLDNIVALDGAVEFLLKYQTVPYAVIGDFDSVTEETLEYLKHLDNIIIEKIYDQMKTDLMKGIEFCDTKKASEIHIYNALGGRLDHSMTNLRVLKKYYSSNRIIRIYGDGEYIQYFRNQKILLKGAKDELIAIMAFPKGEVSSKGLKFDMDNYQIEFAGQESACNALASSEAEVSIAGEALLIVSNSVDIKFNL